MSFLFGEHVVSVDDEFFCRLCQAQFSSYDAIYSHCQDSQHHSWCQECEMVFLDECELMEHLTDEEFHHFCPDCVNGVDYPDAESLSAHRAAAHFKCQECGLILASERSLNTHLIYEHAACEVCLDVFLDMEECHQHMRTHPYSEYHCPRCDNIAETFSAIIRHLESSRDCGRRIQVLRLVKANPHLRDFYIYSGSGFDFYCKSCLLRWSSLGELALHLESTDYCKWLLGPDEAFSYLRELLGRRPAQDERSSSPPPWLSPDYVMH
ncbi:C2H2 finger domain-containing protein [Penicillium subrubescens]|uniref:C2H2-type domain-containing protein n=1 Tax=Penicillium subrubescens TaxID=1316194 RepID=A0A1Q5TE54_9EURO|nr:C2H2 finger domain-containing protein [Penicillium subrubescens]KAJ5873531.1 C2H2 finger domain-containing protein [Penicillium subrubescens]OKO98500.1 hypothetical protein PENSUB_9176 [Penicillium subrubescens]